MRLYTCAKCGHVTYRLGTGALKIAKSCCVGHSFGGTARILGANWLLVPINGRLHWSLVLINSPGRSGSFMVHLDSCPGPHTAAFVADPLRAWLTCMIAKRDGCSLDDAGLHIGTCRYVFCPAQKQPVGSVDCGLYLCAFASRFLSMVDFNEPFTANEFIRQWAEQPHFSPLEVGPQQRTTMYKDILAAHAAAT